MEDTNKKKLITRIVVSVVGALLIIIGILFMIIPPLTNPRYHIYKNGEDVTEKYKKKEDVSTYAYLYDDNFISKNGEGYVISPSKIYEDNTKNEKFDNVMLQITFNVEVEDFSENNPGYSLDGDSSLVLSLKDQTNTYFESSITKSTAVTLKEVKLDNKNLNDITLHLEGSLTISDEEKENTKELDVKIAEESINVIFFMV